MLVLRAGLLSLAVGLFVGVTMTQYIFWVDTAYIGWIHVTIGAFSKESAMKIAQDYQDRGEFRSWEYRGILSIFDYNNT